MNRSDDVVALYDKVLAALKVEPGLVTPRNKVDEAQGYNYKQLEALGLSKGAIKKLERAGLALRGYMPVNRGRLQSVTFETRFILLQDDENAAKTS